MNNREIEDQMRRARPAPSSPTAFQEAGQALLEEIMSASARDGLETGQEPAIDITSRPAAITPGRSRRPWLIAAAAAAAAVAITVPLMLSQGTTDAAPTGELPQQPLVAEGNPYLTVDDDQWRPTSLTQNSAVDGEQQFTSTEGKNLTIWWAPMSLYERMLERVSADVTRQGTLSIFGDQVPLLQTSYYEQVLIPAGDMFVSVRLNGIEGSDDFVSVLGKLRVIEPKQWNEELGQGFVTPEASTAEARTMLRGVPLPPGYDIPDPATELSQDRDVFGSRLLDLVSCAWLGDYTQARADGDEKGMAAVETALIDYSTWPLLREVSQSGGGAQVPIFTAEVSARKNVSASMEQLSCSRD